MKIVAVRTGWGREGGSGGLGRSNLRSDLIILDRTGRTISPLFHADSFVADWTGNGIVSFRDWSYTLLSEEGRIRYEGRVCPPELIRDPTSGCVERVAYLRALGSFVWVHQKFGDSALITTRGELSPHHHEKFLGEWLAPSTDERYIAVGPGRLGRSLNVYDLREKTWTDLGTAVIHPADGWDWMEPSWSPWFADGSQIAFFAAEGLIIRSPDGKRKRVLLRTEEPAGLAVPSPDGRAIGYATFASRPRTSGGGNTPIWNCTGIWVVGLGGSSQPRRLTGQTPSLTYDLRTGRNGYSATFAAAYAVRAKPGAPVSAPCTWEEMERGDVAPRTFTLRTMVARTAIVGDLWADISAHPQSIRDIPALQGTGHENRVPQLPTPKV